jgi:hypothetical protein
VTSNVDALKMSCHVWWNFEQVEVLWPATIKGMLIGNNPNQVNVRPDIFRSFFRLARERSFFSNLGDFASVNTKKSFLCALLAIPNFSQISGTLNNSVSFRSIVKKCFRRVRTWISLQWYFVIKRVLRLLPSLRRGTKFLGVNLTINCRSSNLHSCLFISDCNHGRFAYSAIDRSSNASATIPILNMENQIQIRVFTERLLSPLTLV